MSRTWLSEPALEPFVFPARFVVESDGDSHEWRDNSGLEMRDGLAWQTTALANFVAQGMTGSPLHSLDDAISVLRTIDSVRAQLEQASATGPNLGGHHGQPSS